MAWVAGKNQQVKRNGKYVEVKPGDPVPEAEFWPNRNAWIRQGYVREIADAPAVPAPGKPAEKPVENDLPKPVENPLVLKPVTVSTKTNGKGKGKGKTKKGKKVK